MENNNGPSSDVSRAPTGAQGRVLAVLVQCGSSMTLAGLAEATGLHENPVRGHLEALHEAGHVSRLRSRPSGRGRPPWSYVARTAPYAALAEALARGLETNPGATAREAGTSGGRAWGEELRGLFERDEQSPHERLVLALDHVGFRPELSANEASLRLTRCPFIDVARAHPEVVCSVHLGLIEGALGESLDRAALQPFAEPGACLMTLDIPVTRR